MDKDPLNDTSSIRALIHDDEEFKRIDAEREVMWINLVELHTNVRILDELRCFSPRIAGVHASFFNYIGGTTFRYSVIVANRMWEDNDPGAITLRKLVNRIARAIPDDDLRRRFTRRVKAHYPPAELMEKLERARHKHIAHLDLQARVVDQEKDLGVSFNDLKTPQTHLVNPITC